MFKTGDDMRQDALVLQLFSIMDNVLKEVGLDCNFTIYNLIAFTTNDGLLQFVPKSETIQQIEKEMPISKYLNKFAKTQEEQKLNLDRYIYSCAGYCAATYLLGIGDRHLENIMITEDGRLFHIDFGFIFGKEPNFLKGQLSTKLRISKSMIEPIGGIQGEKYQVFEKKFVESFLILRNKVTFILNLIHLMINSGIGDLQYRDH